MAEQEKPRFEYDDWVGAVRPDPRNTDKLTLLQGYIGQSSETGHIRVYSDESLNNFVEVPEDAIVYAQKLSPAESALGGSKLWLRSDSIITYGDPKSANRPRSTFLEGDIMQQYAAFGQPDTTMMAGAMAGQADTTGPVAQAAPSTPFVLCNVTKATVCQICPTLQVSCFQTVCNIASCNKTICQYVSCFKTICNLQTCQKTICGPKSCIPIFCGGIPCQGASVIPGVSQACNPGGPVINPGFAPMGGQPDTTQMGGYYGTFNPYMY